MLLRLVTGVVLAAVVVGALWWGPNIGVKVMLGIFCLGSLMEYGRIGQHISDPGGQKGGMTLLILPIIGVAAFVGWTVVPAYGVLTGGLAVVALLIVHTVRCDELHPALRRATWDVAGLFYVAGLFAAAAAIISGSGPQSSPRALFLAFLSAVSMGDTMAYFTGRSFGKRPLAPTLSPKKTVEGAIGGLVGSVAGVVLVSLVLNAVPGTLPTLMFTAIVAGAAAQVGDLFESLLKRSAGIKDSGSILPGHGGLLDRVDGILFGAPVFLLYKVLVS